MSVEMLQSAWNWVTCSVFFDIGTNIIRRNFTEGKYEYVLKGFVPKGEFRNEKMNIWKVLFLRPGYFRHARTSTSIKYYYWLEALEHNAGVQWR